MSVQHHPPYPHHLSCELLSIRMIKRMDPDVLFPFHGPTPGPQSVGTEKSFDSRIWNWEKETKKDSFLFLGSFSGTLTSVTFSNCIFPLVHGKMEKASPQRERKRQKKKKNPEIRHLEEQRSLILFVPEA